MDSCQFNIKKMSLSGFEEQLIMQSGNEKIKEINLPRIRKKYSFEWENIDDDYLSNAFIWLDSRLDLKTVKTFDFWKNDFDLKNLHFTEHNHIHYADEDQCYPFLLKIENICGIIERGENDDRKHYFKPTALLQTGFISDIFAQIEDKMIYELDVDYNTICNTNKFEISDSAKKLPIEQIIYLRNVIVAFEKIETVTIRRREKNKIISRIIAGEILLNKNI